MTKNLQLHFYDIMKICSISNTQAEKHWQSLANHYNEPHRYYHNFTHIKAMLGYFEKLRFNKEHQLDNPTAIALAIYYHDVIYDATKLDNEKQSAEFFQNVFKDVLDKELLDRVIQLIMLTEKHQFLDSNGSEDDNDAKLFLDMDLSILGQPWAIYQVYAHNIRKEYAHVSEADYQQGRKAVLENFLQRPNLYFSEQFYKQCEEQARTNLRKEIGLLEKK